METDFERRDRWLLFKGIPKLSAFKNILGKGVSKSSLSDPPPPPSPPKLPAYLESHPNSFVPAVEIVEDLAGDDIQVDHVENTASGVQGDPVDNNFTDAASEDDPVTAASDNPTLKSAEIQESENDAAIQSEGQSDNPFDALVEVEDIGSDRECEKQGAAGNSESFIGSSNSSTPGSTNNDFEGFSNNGSPPKPNFMRSGHSQEVDENLAPPSDESMISSGDRAAHSGTQDAPVQQVCRAALQEIPNNPPRAQPEGSNIYQGLSKVSIYVF